MSGIIPAIGSHKTADTTCLTSAGIPPEIPLKEAQHLIPYSSPSHTPVRSTVGVRLYCALPQCEMYAEGQTLCQNVIWVKIHGLLLAAIVI
ncbi:hypothetical protein AYI69_g1412 [Smittium culicis]|uniref:Uncharacterized protein n=1 Tax=Smittium culicis TaxID=133412 RepID=A0A1R1YQD5_9FUNG|nr:hypothetical protein AYI69_g1412 [Smittium culicis]